MQASSQQSTANTPSFSHTLRGVGATLGHTLKKVFAARRPQDEFQQDIKKLKRLAFKVKVSYLGLMSSIVVPPMSCVVICSQKFIGPDTTKYTFEQAEAIREKQMDQSTLYLALSGTVSVMGAGLLYRRGKRDQQNHKDHWHEFHSKHANCNISWPAMWPEINKAVREKRALDDLLITEAAERKQAFEMFKSNEKEMRIQAMKTINEHIVTDADLAETICYLNQNCMNETDIDVRQALLESIEEMHIDALEFKKDESIFILPEHLDLLNDMQQQLTAPPSSPLAIVDPLKNQVA